MPHAYLNREAADAAREEAMQRAYDACPAEWRDCAQHAIWLVASQMPEFTSDNVWVHLWKPHEPRALGPEMAKACRDGIIEKTDRTVNTLQVTRNAAPVRIWRSLIHRGRHG